MATQDEVAQRFERLPKWAQDEIHALRRTVDTLRDSLKAQQCNEPSRIAWGWAYMNDTAKGFLRDNERLTFTMKDSQRVLRAHFNEDGNRLQCHCDGQIVVRGVSRNWVELEVD